MYLHTFVPLVDVCMCVLDLCMTVSSLNVVVILSSLVYRRSSGWVEMGVSVFLSLLIGTTCSQGNDCTRLTLERVGSVEQSHANRFSSSTADCVGRFPNMRHRT